MGVQVWGRIDLADHTHIGQIRLDMGEIQRLDFLTILIYTNIPKVMAQ